MGVGVCVCSRNCPLEVLSNRPVRPSNSKKVVGGVFGSKKTQKSTRTRSSSHVYSVSPQHTHTHKSPAFARPPKVAERERVALSLPNPPPPPHTHKKQRESQHKSKSKAPRTRVRSLVGKLDALLNALLELGNDLCLQLLGLVVAQLPKTKVLLHAVHLHTARGRVSACACVRTRG